MEEVDLWLLVNTELITWPSTFTRKDHERVRRMSLIRILPNVVRRSLYSSLVRVVL